MYTTDPQDIVKALIKAGDSQSAISEATGISQATISRILAGLHADPLTSTTRKLHEYAATRLKVKQGRSRR